MIDKSKFTTIEKRYARIAFNLIKKNGGNMMFDEYNEKMFSKKYLYNMHCGLSGWELSDYLNKSNHDKMCVLIACKMGLVRIVKNSYVVDMENKELIK